MAKRGRPKKSDKAQNRIHSIVFDEGAENIFRNICKVRGGKKWIHEFVSRKLKEEFGNDAAEKVLIEELNKAQQERDKYEDKILDISNKLKELRQVKESGMNGNK